MNNQNILRAVMGGFILLSIIKFEVVGRSGNTLPYMRTLTLCVEIGLAYGVYAILSFAVFRNIRSVVEGLRVSSRRLAELSTQAYGGSKHLADRTAEQSSSAQETSSALEQISGHITATAENAERARSLTGAQRTGGNAAALEMNNMKTAMEAIRTSNQSIFKVLRTVEDIARQTHILALNAAVEAARAGDAGLSFNVIATEVRRLAQSSTDAARECAAMLQTAQTRAAEGLLVCEQLEQSLQTIYSQAKTIDTIVSEVATASHEQRVGIEQISVALTQFQSAIEANVLSAESATATSEALNVQALSTQCVADQLLNSVGGETKESELLQNIAQLAVVVGNVIHELQKERGRSSLFLAQNDARLGDNLSNQHRETDRRIDDLLDLVGVMNSKAQFGAFFVQKLAASRRSLRTLAEWREDVLSRQVNARQAIDTYTPVITLLLDLIGQMFKFSTSPVVTVSVAGYVNLMQAKERAGQERALLCRVLASGDFETADFNDFAALVSAQQVYLNNFLVFATDEQKRFFSDSQRSDVVEQIGKIRQSLLSTRSAKCEISPESWFKVSTSNIEILKKVEDKLAGDLEALTGSESHASNTTETADEFEYVPAHEGAAECLQPFKRPSQRLVVG